jgi:hypothetical protein
MQRSMPENSYDSNLQSMDQSYSGRQNMMNNYFRDDPAFRDPNVSSQQSNYFGQMGPTRPQFADQYQSFGQGQNGGIMNSYQQSPSQGTEVMDYQARINDYYNGAGRRNNKVPTDARPGVPYSSVMRPQFFEGAGGGGFGSLGPGSWGGRVQRF